MVDTGLDEETSSVNYMYRTIARAAKMNFLVAMVLILHSSAAALQLQRRVLLGAVLIPGPAAAMMPVCSELITENCRRPYKLT
jgi:hypothetical protein